MIITTPFWLQHIFMCVLSKYHPLMMALLILTDLSNLQYTKIVRRSYKYINSESKGVIFRSYINSKPFFSLILLIINSSLNHLSVLPE